jgi:hypothetical protein
MPRTCPKYVLDAQKKSLFSKESPLFLTTDPEHQISPGKRLTEFGVEVNFSKSALEGCELSRTIRQCE